jgi:MSHA biogenesis protein MshJ
MKANKWLNGFFALPRRERVIALLGIAALIVAVIEFSWVRPQRLQARDLQARMAATDGKIASVAEALKARSAPPPAQAAAALRAERDALRVRVKSAEEVLRSAAADVKMTDIVRTFVAGAPGVTVGTMRTVPSTVYFAPPPPPAPEAIPAKGAAPVPAAPAASVPTLPTIYRHGIEVELKGAYPALVNALAGLEGAAPTAVWSTARLSVQKFPDATLRLTLFTLSLNPEASFE